MTVGMVVNSKYKSKAVAHTARSGDTNARIVVLGLAQEKNGAVAGIQEPEAEGDGKKSVQWSDIDSDHSKARQAHCLSTMVQTITFVNPILQKSLH